MSDNPALVSLESEQCAIGSAILTTGTQLSGLLAALSPEMFWRPAHQEWWRAIGELHAKGAPVDLVTLRQHLGPNGLADVGGLDYLYQVAEMVPSPANAWHYAATVRECYCRREIKAGLKGLAQQLDAGAEPAAVLGQVLDVAKSATLPDRFAFDMADISLDRDQRTVSSGYEALDSLSAKPGLACGQVTLVCANTGVGKSMFMTDMARRMLHNGADRIAYISLADLDREDLKRRMMKQMCGFWSPPHDLEKFDKWSRALDSFKLWDMVVYDPQEQEGAGTVESVSAWLLGEHQRRPWTAVFHDYAQETTTSKDLRSDYDQMTHVSRVVRYTAKRLGCPYVLASQLTLAANGRWQSKGARVFEERAAMVLRIERETGDDGKLSPYGKVVVAKNRFGLSGAIPLRVDQQTQRYELGENA